MALFLLFDMLDVVGLLTIPLFAIAVLGLLFYIEFVELLAYFLDIILA